MLLLFFPGSEDRQRQGRQDPVGCIPSSGAPLRLPLCPLTPFCLLVLPECPLVALHDHPAVLTDRCWHFFDPVARSLTHHFSACRVNSSASLVATKSRRSGHESRFQAAEQQ